MSVDQVELVSALGFGGNVSNGLISHPNGVDIIYPLGSTVVIKNTKTGKQVFLRGHSDKVSCIAVSRDGSMIVSGQTTHVGCRAKTILWDYDRIHQSGYKGRSMPDFHSGKVQALEFSPTGKYFVSCGGTDDNQIAVWNTETCRKLVSKAFGESALACKFYNNRDDVLVTAGYYHVVRWKIDYGAQKMDYVQANMGPLQRVYRCVAIDENDEFAYCGTTTGDVFKVSLSAATPHFKVHGNELFRAGIRSISFVKIGNKSHLLLGCGNGVVVLLDASGKGMKKIRSGKVMGEVTSISPVRRNLDESVTKFYIGTKESNIYLCVDINNLEKSIKLRASCHYAGINDVAFLDDTEGVFATCSSHDIRVWNAAKQQEVLRIRVPNVTCNCIALPKDGRTILSGWDDGKIRAFAPVSGELLYTINDAHANGVTALASTNNCALIISGGGCGSVRFWDATTKKMRASLKEHKSTVTSIAVRSDDKECVSSSDDGSCIQWDVYKQRRTQAMFASTMFKCVAYHPDESQLLTCGSDRKLTYWDAFDGNPIRIIDKSFLQLNAIAIDRQGEYFACGGNGCELNLFSYDEGEMKATGIGHSGHILAIKISPKQRQIVSVGNQGAIFVWKYPFPDGLDRDDRLECKA
mmetsp:Transcript_13296/g.23860  ORF Transcript_13296/g.23860 Transcript_13296/m.23860 type:complete len:636 (-) Transcript_13296:19-1926(-)